MYKILKIERKLWSKIFRFSKRVISRKISQIFLVCRWYNLVDDMSQKIPSKDSSN